MYTLGLVWAMLSLRFVSVTIKFATHLECVRVLLCFCGKLKHQQLRHSAGENNLCFLFFCEGLPHFYFICYLTLSCLALVAFFHTLTSTSLILCVCTSHCWFLYASKCTTRALNSEKLSELFCRIKKVPNIEGCV